jgi:hypothetical protein
MLRIKRTLDGPAMDKVISDVQAGKALLVERYRPSDWRQGELSAERFAAEMHHAAAPTAP